MSFRCGKCDKPQLLTREGFPVKPVRRVVEKRYKNYLGGHQGWEIVKELNLCEPCSKTQAEPVWKT